MTQEEDKRLEELRVKLDEGTILTPQELAEHGHLMFKVVEDSIGERLVESLIKQSM